MMRMSRGSPQGPPCRGTPSTHDAAGTSVGSRAVDMLDCSAAQNIPTGVPHAGSQNASPLRRGLFLELRGAVPWRAGAPQCARGWPPRIMANGGEKHGRPSAHPRAGGRAGRPREGALRTARLLIQPACYLQRGGVLLVARITYLCCRSSMSTRS